MMWMGSILASALGLAAVAPLREPHHQGRTRYREGLKGVGKGRYLPHQGKREIARRVRQAERDATRQLDRSAFYCVGDCAGLSCRMRVID